MDDFSHARHIVDMGGAHGLVHKIIQQSVGPASWQTPESADGVMRRLLEAVSLTPARAGQLRDMPATALLDLQQRITPRTGSIFYWPVCDGDLIPADPFTASATSASRGLLWLCGTNLDEIKFFRAMDQAVDTLDDAGLLARCRALRPGVGQAEHIIETYRTAPSAPSGRQCGRRGRISIRRYQTQCPLLLYHLYGEYHS
jgi:para-nitrobenzyl esterase